MTTALVLHANGDETWANANVCLYLEGGRTHRIPQLSGILGNPNSFFYIRANSGLSGPNVPINNPYQIFCRVVPPSSPQTVNQAVANLTGGNPKYPWYEDIVVLKFAGRRGAQYVPVGEWNNGRAAVQHFFKYGVIFSQEE
jgi:hypothetical protein